MKILYALCLLPFIALILFICGAVVHMMVIDSVARTIIFSAMGVFVAIFLFAFGASRLEK